MTSMKKLSIVPPLQKDGGANGTTINNNGGDLAAGPAGTTNGRIHVVHGVNILLAGAMISSLFMVIFIACYCCHRGGKKSPRHHLPVHWREQEMASSIFTVDTQTMYAGYDDYPIAQHPPPEGWATSPPPYEVIFPETKDKDDQNGLPNYETAVRLHLANSNANGYL